MCERYTFHERRNTQREGVKVYVLCGREWLGHVSCTCFSFVVGWFQDCFPILHTLYDVLKECWVLRLGLKKGASTYVKASVGMACKSQFSVFRV